MFWQQKVNLSKVCLQMGRVILVIHADKLLGSLLMLPGQCVCRLLCPLTKVWPRHPEFSKSQVLSERYAFSLSIRAAFASWKQMKQSCFVSCLSVAVIKTPRPRQLLGERIYLGSQFQWISFHCGMRVMAVAVVLTEGTDRNSHLEQQALSREHTWNGWSFNTSDPAPSDILTPARPPILSHPNSVPPTEEQAFKCQSLWGTLSLETPYFHRSPSLDKAQARKGRV